MTVANPTSTQPTTDDNQSGVAASKPQTIREFEAVLRGIGFSRAEATAIAARGFKASLSIEAQRAEELDELTAAIEKFKSSFKIKETTS